MILPLSAVWMAAHGAYRALGFRSRLLEAGARNAHLYDRAGRGSAPPVLLVHGMGGNAAGFLPIARAVVRASRRVVAVELPGHGRARLAPAEAPVTIAEAAQVVGAALREFSEPAVLIGSSLGGALSLFTAVAMPERVAGVIGLNPAGAPLLGAERESVLRAFRGDPLALTRRLYRKPPRLAPLFSRDLGRHWKSAPVAQLVSELESDMPGIDPGLLAQIRAPVLVLWGEHDRILPASSVEYFRQHLGAASVELIAESGHLPMVERSAQVAARIVRFLNEL